MEKIIKNSGADKYTVFPIQYPNLWNFYKKHEGLFWTTEELRLSDDLIDWNTKLNDNEKFFIKNVLAFFASSDGIVNENLVLNFYNEVEIAEARNFYSMQILIEAIHNETYSVLIDTYVSNEEEKANLFNAIETIPAVKRKADWAMKWIENGSTLVEGIPVKYMEKFKEMYNNKELDMETKEALGFLVKERPSFAQRLLAFVCVEGLFFSGSFCAIYWLKSRGLMPGLCTSNDFISRDENIHTEFAIELYKMLDNKLTTEKVHELFNDAVEIETEFITESLPVSLLGMNCNLMTQYIKYVADRWLVLLDYPKLYNAVNPFTFMELISMTSKTNFFEHKETNYQRPSVNTTEKEKTLEFDDFDF